MEGNKGSRLGMFSCVVALMATGLMAQTELLPNGNFGKGDSAWVLVANTTTNGGSATEAVTDSQYVITIRLGGYYEYSVQMSDTLLTILNGHTYHIRIIAMSSIARPFTFGVGMTYSPWTTYSGVNNVGEMVGNLGVAMDTTDTTFTMTFPDDSGGARFFMNFGHATGWPSVDNSTVTVSTVVLEDMGSTKVIRFPLQMASKFAALAVNSRGIMLGRAISPSASLKVFSLQGRLLEDLSLNAKTSSQILWNSTGLKSGSCIVRLVEEGRQTSQKGIVVQ